MVNRNVSGVEVKADRIVAKLIDRLFATEKRLTAQQKEVSELYEMLAEVQPFLTADGKLRLRALMDSDDVTEYRVEIDPSSVAEWDGE